jgi:hypothetical protein
MARIRTIKPEFFTSEDIVSLSPLARLLYISTWCEADKEGRLQWKPGTFKLRYFPADNCDINALCAEIVGAGLVVLYGDGLAYIPQFAKHQHINPRESDSQLPDPHATPPKATRAPRVATRHDASARDDDAQGGREGKGRSNTRVDDATGVHGFPPGFDEFWSAYPRKTAKTAAAKAYARLRPDADLQFLMLVAVARQAASPAWTKDGGEFIPHAATWINGRRWEDGTAPASVDRFAGAI